MPAGSTEAVTRPEIAFKDVDIVFGPKPDEALKLLDDGGSHRPSTWP
jgi:hypothetical protein